MKQKRIMNKKEKMIAVRSLLKTIENLVEESLQEVSKDKMLSGETDDLYPKSAYSLVDSAIKKYGEEMGDLNPRNSWRGRDE